jgi:3-isopropylmalate/(R)-2-methylmalate dehydratase small subunit
MSSSAIHSVEGRAIVLRGDDIDTDRIMPARFLRAITFEGLERHVFEDDRHEAQARGAMHAFDDPSRRQASVLIVGRNFGCGSSREHAPQALRRWGIRAVVGESFAEIFQGNSLMIGLPCVTMAPAALERLRLKAEADAALTLHLDLDRSVLSDNPVTLPASARAALLSGEWDATALLLANYDDVRAVEARLPYKFPRS